MTHIPDKDLAEHIATGLSSIVDGYRKDVFDGPVEAANKGSGMPDQAIFCREVTDDGSQDFVEGVSFVRAVVQVRVRSNPRDLDGGRTLANQARAAVHTVVMDEYTETRVREGRPTYLGNRLDDKGSHHWSFNVEIWWEELRSGEEEDIVSRAMMNMETPTATTIATPGTYVKAAGVTFLQEEDEFSMPANNRLQYDGAGAKPIDMHVAFSVTSDTNNVVMTARLVINGAPTAAWAEDTEIERKIGTGTDVGAMPVIGLKTLSPGDFIELWLTADAAVELTVEKMAGTVHS